MTESLHIQIKIPPSQLACFEYSLHFFTKVGNLLMFNNHHTKLNAVSTHFTKYQSPRCFVVTPPCNEPGQYQ